MQQRDVTFWFLRLMMNHERYANHFHSFIVIVGNYNNLFQYL